VANAEWKAGALVMVIRGFEQNVGKFGTLKEYIGPVPMIDGTQEDAWVVHNENLFYGYNPLLGVSSMRADVVFAQSALRLIPPLDTEDQETKELEKSI